MDGSQMMKQLTTIEQVAEVLKADWKKHGSGGHAYLLENSINRLKRKEQAEFQALMQRTIGNDEFGRET